MRGTRTLIPLALCSGLLLFPIVTHAAWPTDPTRNVPVCTATNYQQYPTLASDGAGGAFVAWQDYRSGTADLYVQRLTSAGTAAWTDGGIAVCTAANLQQNAAMIPDGFGGAIVAWMDNRGTTGHDVYVQRVNAAGGVRWTANGVAVCTAADGQYYPQLVSDGAGGAIVVWYDYRNAAHYDVYAQRVDSTGTVRWTTNGVAVCNATGAQLSPSIAADGAGGAVIAWQDQRSTINDIYAQRLSSTGTALWTANGVVVCNYSTDQTAPVIASDGSGGAIVAWQDMRSGVFGVYTQRIGAAGTAAWTANGLSLSNGIAGQVETTILSDDNGGAIVVWCDMRNDAADVYAQRVNSAGSLLWSTAGLAVGSATGVQRFGTPVSDGAGGAVIVWQDTRTGTNDVYAQHVTAAGTPTWFTSPFGSEHVAMSTARDEQTEIAVTTDGSGGVIVAWQDTRNGVAADVYAQRMERFGKLGSPEPVITSVSDVPADQGGWVRLAWQASPLDPAWDAELGEYEVFRSVPPNTARVAITKGEAVRLAVGERPSSDRRGYLFTTQGATEYAWEFVAAVTAQHMFAAYSRPVATTSDSVAGANPTTAFLVVARSLASNKYWVSDPALGYSVDNLAPGTPSPFIGTYAAGATTMHWTPVAAPDLAAYHVHRGTDPAFTPGDANQVAAITGTDLTDAPGAAYVYKVCAVDVHGNESSYATLVPNGTVAVEDVPATLAFAAPRPSPAQGRVTLVWSLAHDGPVRLSLYDAAGRCVRTLEDGVATAGTHHSVFALDDANGPLPTGLYLARLEAEGRTLVQRVAMLR